MSDSIRVCRQCHVRLAGHEPTTGCDGIEAPARLQPLELRRESCFMCGQKDAENERLRQLYEKTVSGFNAEIERLKALYASTRDARRVMRALLSRDPEWEVVAKGAEILMMRRAAHPLDERVTILTLDDWEREEGLPDIDEEGDDD